MSSWIEGDAQGSAIRVHYHRTGNGHQTPSILLLHGFTDNGSCWTRVAHDLENSYDVIMTDARGHGRSGGIAGGFSVDILADDTAAVIQDLDLHRPFVFGHSMGAITAAVLAARYPELIRAVTLEDPPIGDDLRHPPDDGEARTAQQQWFADLRAVPREERLERALRENPRWAEEEIVPWSDSKVEFDVELLNLRGTFHVVAWREVLSQITCPILLLTGDPELGALVTPHTAEEASKIWQNGEVVHLHGAGHNIHRDRYEETMATVRAFLSAH